jgi:HipA-like C-terminal domain
VLSSHGAPVAATSVVESATRTYLISERFDRIGKQGRRHVVSVGAVHAAFVAGSYSQWGATCDALARQRRLSTEDAARATALLQFGRLIGNSDMHAGNLGLVVRAEDLSKGRFSLAPVYDMLPMRWRPDPAIGVQDYSPFEPDAASASGPAVGPAHEFWARLAAHQHVSRALRKVAGDMARRLHR